MTVADATPTGLKICIVDDDPLLLGHLAEAVSGLGHTTLPALKVDTALEIVAASSVDAVVVDILMPDRDGLDFIMAIRGVVPRIRIVAMSGGGRIGANAVLTMATGLGADAVLAKPFSITELEQALTG